MSYDLYANLKLSNYKDIYALTNGQYHGLKIPDIGTRIQLLSNVAANNSLKNYAVSGDRKQGGGYKSLVHTKGTVKTEYAQKLIEPEKNRLDKLGLLKPDPSALRHLPLGSWFLQFEFTLAKPWLSKDDASFYVSDNVNPVRKDKVFKVPIMASSSWKGVLRWTAMQVHLAEEKDKMDDAGFAAKRLRLALIFGTEKGGESDQPNEFAKYIDDLKPNSKQIYKDKIKQHFFIDIEGEMQNHSGRLMFYPSFFDLIGLEVINPHSRKTRAGSQPIYLECVPAKAKATFSLLYLPYDLYSREDMDQDKIRTEAKEDLKLIAKAIAQMMLTYGFSAKRTSGYGVTEDQIINGMIKTHTDERPLKDKELSKLAEEAEHVQF